MSEKTEQPTAKKLRDARQEGQVAHSKDFTQTLLVCALFGYMIVNARQIVAGFAQLMLVPVSALALDFRAAVNVVVMQLATDGALLLLPFLLIVIIVGVLGETLQVGILLAFKAIKPSGKKLDVAANVKNMFSSKNMVEFIKSNLKVVFLSVLLYFVLRAGRL